MNKTESRSAVEAISGSVTTALAMTAIAAFGDGGGPLAIAAALLPILAAAPAGVRQKARLDAALEDIHTALAEHQDRFAQLTDQQFSLINQSIAALLQTTNEDKINLLKRAVVNSLDAQPMLDQEVVFLGRIVRDISVDETRFLVENYSYQWIWNGNDPPPLLTENVLHVVPNTLDSSVLLGLQTLGLVSSPSENIDSMGFMTFSPMVAKLLTLVVSKPAA